jgi:hypothetical protein
MAAQRPLVAAADLIQAVARHHSGFTSIALSEHAVLLYWKGDPPAAVVKVIDDARRIARVHLKSAAYSLAELERAERKLLAYLRSNPDGPFHSIKIPADGSGLIAGTTRNLAAAQAVSQNAFAQVSGYR